MTMMMAMTTMMMVTMTTMTTMMMVTMTTMMMVMMMMMMVMTTTTMNMTSVLSSHCIYPTSRLLLSGPFSSLVLEKMSHEIRLLEKVG